MERHLRWAGEAEPELRRLVKEQAATIRRLEVENFSLRCALNEANASTYAACSNLAEVVPMRKGR